jgi:NitT/TauT family transport system substrate-binding protein
MRQLARAAALAAALLVLAAACGDGDEDVESSDAATATSVTDAATATSTTDAATTTEAATAAMGEVTAEGIPAERCEANRAAGTITYLSGFDLAASASIIEVVVADEKGYFEEMCLDVDVRPSFTVQNYPLIGADTAQFASSGSFNEMLAHSVDGAELVTVVHEGKTGIDALLVKPELGAQSPADLAGATIGVKGALPPGERAMLAKYGLEEGRDYETVTVEGFDPKVHWELPIDALPVFKSNEPGQLERAGIGYQMFDPAEEDIPGSFGILYTNRQFLDEHPTAAQDFVRAAMKGLADAIADPDAATEIAFARITDGGNPNFLSLEGELYRWRTESQILVDSSGGEPVGLVHGALFEDLLQAYVDAGVLEEMPDLAGSYEEDLVAGVYADDGTVIWPQA